MRHPYIFIRVMKDIIVGPESDKSTLLSICMAISCIQFFGVLEFYFEF